MKFSTYTLVSLGIILASLGYYFQTKIPLLASILALTGASLFLVAAGRLRKVKNKLKAEKKAMQKKNPHKKTQ